MKFLILLTLLFSLIGCEDKLSNDNPAPINSSPTLCPELPPTGGESSPLEFAGIQEITDVERTQLMVKWIPVKGFHQYHVIQIDGKSRKIVRTVGAKRSQILIRKLTANTKYTFLVRAMDKSGLLDNNDKVLSAQTLEHANFNNLSSLSLNGKQAVNLGASDQFTTAGALSVSLWFNKKSSNINSIFNERLFTFFTKANIARSGLSAGIERDKLYIHFTNKLKFFISKDIPVKYNLNEWNHLLVTHNNAFIFVYLNGKQVNKFKNDIAPFGKLDAKIGAHQLHLDLGFKGYIDEFAFYKNFFNKNQVKFLYNQGLAQDLTTSINRRHLKHWYRLGDHANDTNQFVQDLVGGKHGVPSNGEEFKFVMDAPGAN